MNTINNAPFIPVTTPSPKGEGRDRGFRYDTRALNNIPFSAVAQRYASGIRKVGAQLVMLCPYHEDHHPSFCVSPKKVNRGKCWSCGKSVGVIDFVMEICHLDFLSACERLSNDFSIPKLEEWVKGSDPLTHGIPKLKKWVKGSDPLTHNQGEGVAIRQASNAKSAKNRAHARPLGGLGGLKYARTIIDSDAVGRTRMKEWDEQNLTKRAYINREWYAPFVSKENSLCKALGHVFLQEGIDLVTEEYQLGCYDKLGNPDDVMFPSIDREGRIHNIKVQHYCTDPENDRFLHADRKHMFWLGSLLAKEYNSLGQNGEKNSTPSPFILPSIPSASTPPSGVGGPGLLFDSTCFFGEHLLAKYPADTVMLVESPKNAVIGKLENPGYTWIAVGNKTNLTPKRLECLRDRDVIVIPDNDAMDDWKRELYKVRYLAKFQFSSFCTTKLRDLGEKGDVADYIISKVRI